uniref:Uncharacterized protein n=1 Tax=Setaria viridis TaxID=4556 RepID=A0A4U6UGZ2_SETVI|nr:hypothetical protein SEVIR_5G234900v2 [Setaria viridis]TKW15392.1 hypothetical protein SEVIR_5G234900v2 [Setaria viridis]TKW15393.1 hypothetical protein SEVIR_5G234900v2 [Setaria viridis]
MRANYFIACRDLRAQAPADMTRSRSHLPPARREPTGRRRAVAVSSRRTRDVGLLRPRWHRHAQRPQPKRRRCVPFGHQRRHRHAGAREQARGNAGAGRCCCNMRRPAGPRVFRLVVSCKLLKAEACRSAAAVVLYCKGARALRTTPPDFIIVSFFSFLNLLVFN